MSKNFHRVTETLMKSLVIALIVFAMGHSTGNTVQGQDEPVYETLPIAPEYLLPDDSGIDKNDRSALVKFNNEKNAILAKRRDMQRQVQDAVSGRGSNPNLVEGWLAGFALPEMTQTDNDTLQRLGELRQRFFRSYLENNTSVREPVINLTISTMKNVAEGNFHPACRINAVYVLGRLNTREGNRSSGIIPLPRTELRSWLLQIATSDTQPEYLRVAAMVGVERHSALQGAGSQDILDNASIRELNDAMVSLITQGASEDLSREANYWLKRRAINVIGNLGDAGDNGRYAKVLRDVIANKSEKLLVRTDAVLAYSRLNFADASAANVEEMIELVARLVVTAADADSNYIDEKLNNIEFIAQFLDGKKAGDSTEQKSQGPSRGTGGQNEDAPGGGGMGGVNKSKEAPEILPAYHRELVRRRFKHYLYNCKIALAGSQRGLRGGLSKVAPANDIEFIDALIVEFDKLMTATDIYEPDPDADDSKEKPDDKGLGSDKDKKPLTLADQLKKALDEGAAQISAVVSKYRPEEPEQPGDDSEPPTEASGG